MLTLFPDTNVFLQCRPLHDLPWRELSADAVTVMVAPPVWKEIDRQKGDGNHRRAKRARAANGLLRQVIASPQSCLVLREAEPRVTLCIAPRLPLDPGNYPDLDLSDPDQALVATANRYAQSTGAAVTILSGDVGTILHASLLNLPAYPISDGWLAPPPRDERDKRIQELEEELDRRSSDQPKIEITADPGELQFELMVFEPLATEEIRALLDQAQQAQPMARRFPGVDGEPLPRQPPPHARMTLSALRGRWVPPEPEEVQCYREDQYPRWIDDARAFLSTIHVQLARPSRSARLRVTIDNLGARPAEHAMIRIVSSKGLRFWEPGEPGSVGMIGFPKPPSPPSAQWKSVPSAFDVKSLLNSVDRQKSFDISSFEPPRPRDMFAWYHEPHRPSRPVSRIELRCQSFRHRLKPCVFDLEIVLARDVTGGRIEIEVSAANLAEPVRRSVTVKATSRRANTQAEASRLVPAPPIFGGQALS